jgi:single-strand DNA-binding protein
MNNCNFIGRICKDLELKTTNSGTAYCKFTLAVDRKFKKEGQSSADFLNCIAWGKTAELITKYLSKGSKIGITARVEMGSYEKDGTKFYTTDFVVEGITFCESKGQAKGDAYEPSTNSSLVEGDEDELPF